MAVLNVNPTRMELTRLKKQLSTAVRGHKLLKDKRDELMRRFLELIMENKELRAQVEQEIKGAHAHFVTACAVMDKKSLDGALMLPKQQVTLEVDTENVMSVEIPRFETKLRTSSEGDIYPYGFADTSFELDSAVSQVNGLLPLMLRLAETEKATQRMAVEIEKTRRRVNALEHVMIPRYQDTIRFITMKLEENDRSSRTRLMKVKDMMIKQQIEHKKANPDML